ncbi:MAG: CHAP domain-containing protein [Firmicutes bacterium]|nr:CHAP domain-containing protein [Bacillota bacterium]
MPENNNLENNNEIGTTNNNSGINPQSFTNTNNLNNNNVHNNQTDSTKKLVDTAAKGAAEYFAPGVGSKVYDAAKNMPVIGNAIDQKINDVANVVNKNPLAKNAAKKLDNSGMIDGASNAISAIGGSKGGQNKFTNASPSTPATPNGLGNRSSNTGFNQAMLSSNMSGNNINVGESLPKEELPTENTNTATTSNSNGLTNNILNNDSGNNGSSSSSSSGDIMGNLAKTYFQKHKLMIIASCSGIAFFVLILFVILGGGVQASNEGGALLSTYISCDTITIVDPDTDIETTLDFEQYVAGVVTAESGRSDSPEAAKAQAVIARTYAIKNTNFCTTTIENSQNKQVYREPSEIGLAAAEATKGIIMVDSEDSTNLLSTYFASYSDGKRDWPAFPACTPINCTDSSCTTTFYKVGPDNTYEENVFTMNRYNSSGNYWNGLDLTNQNGHCYGLSQVGAWYLETVGYDYKQILDEFYFDYSLASMNAGSGISTMIASLDWFEIRTERTGITSQSYWFEDNIFYRSKKAYIGQCTWYAHGRAKEILATALVKNALTQEEYNSTINILNRLSGNAGDWWAQNKALGSVGLSYSSDVPKVGSIVVFGGSSNTACGEYHNCGHVGIIEDVYYDENGNWTSVWLSDGWKNDSCDSTACFSSKMWTKEEVLNYRSGCRPLLGFIYLIDYEEQV